MLEKRDFKKGDIIVYCDEEFEVIKNYGCSGKVREVQGGAIIDNFYWNFQGSRCELAKKDLSFDNCGGNCNG